MGSLLWNISVESEHALGEAITEADAHFNKDKAFRLWGTSHGGVYVPVDERTQPNPDLEHLPERDLVTPSGRQLTLINPSYMLRQIMSEYDDLLSVKQKLTTFPDKLLNPVNKPDSWELQALTSLQAGAEEVTGIAEINNNSFMRLMRPLFIEEGCLKCHGSQGYGIGDFSGGLEIAVPMAPYSEHEREKAAILCFSYAVIWLFGVISIIYAYRYNKKVTIERVKMIFKLEQMNFRLEEYSYQDGLTGIANRRMFDTVLEREWATARREKHQLALIMIDIDYFKYYNDNYGHQAGDDCLKSVAATLSRVSKRATDLVARYGGEEFVLLLPNIDEQQALRLAEQCRSDIEALQIPHENSITAPVVTISVGIAIALPSSVDSQAETVIKAADQALYRAKEGGRNRVEVAL